MPLDYCHPTAPHKRLRLPEWYVSSLMMDRALDAICRGVKKLDRNHDIPYLAGYSLDGKTIYIDRHMPQFFKFRGRTIDTDRFRDEQDDDLLRRMLNSVRAGNAPKGIHVKDLAEAIGELRRRVRWHDTPGAHRAAAIAAKKPTKKPAKKSANKPAKKK